MLTEFGERARAIDAGSSSETSRMRRVTMLGGFTGRNSGYYINLDGQQMIPYGQPVRFNERLVTINRDFDHLQITQELLPHGFYHSFSFELPVVIPEASVAQLLIPSDKSWKDFFDGDRISGVVI